MIKDETSVRLRKTSWFLLVLACLSVSSAVAAQAQQFSADIVTRHDDAPAPAGRLSVLDGKVRIETPEVPDGFFLVDPAKPSAYFVRPTARIYMDARQSSRLTRLFVPVDPDAPCQQWQAMARLAGVAGQGEWRCERAGEETIDGHNTVAFRVSSGAGRGISAGSIASAGFRCGSRPTTAPSLGSSGSRTPPAGLILRASGKLREIQSRSADRADQAK